MVNDQRAKDLGELIARRMEEENPDLVKSVRSLVRDALGKSEKVEAPWYKRAYYSVRDFITGNY